MTPLGDFEPGDLLALTAWTPSWKTPRRPEGTFPALVVAVYEGPETDRQTTHLMVLLERLNVCTVDQLKRAYDWRLVDEFKSERKTKKKQR